MVRLINAVLLVTLVTEAYGTHCTSILHGRCKSIFSDCTSGYSETLSYCGVLQSCCFPPSHGGHVTHPTSSTSHGSCGNPQFSSSHRIVGGHETVHGAYPWQVSVRQYGSHICGGTLINNQWILTAAHCFEDESLTHSHWSMGIGMHRLSHSRGYVHSVSGIYVHHGFDSTSMMHDIALVKLSKPIDITGPYAKAACLPHSNENFDNVVCTASGWGATANDSGPNVSWTLEFISRCNITWLQQQQWMKVLKARPLQNGDVVDRLREVDLAIIRNSECSYYMHSGDIFSSNMCAGYLSGGKDTCQGDSGGPLACKMGGSWKVAGVVSWGYACAGRRSPGVYTRVSSYLSWIQTTTSRH